MTNEIRTTDNFGIIADAKPIKRKDKYLPALANNFMDLTMDNFIYINNPEQMPIKYKIAQNGDNVVSIYSNKDQTIIIKRPNIFKLGKKNEKKSYLKLLAYIFSKAKHLKDKYDIGNTANPTMEIPKQELVDIGIYNSKEIVTKAIKRYRPMFLQLSVNIIQQGNNYKVSNQDIDVASNIFMNIVNKPTHILITINPFIWQHIEFYYTIIPNWAFKLSDRAFNLTYFISEQLRRNSKAIDEKGFYRITMETVCEKLNIPKKEECANPTKQIKNEIIKIVNEINSNQDYNDLLLEIEADGKSPSIDKFLKGYLKIIPQPMYKMFFVDIRNTQIDQREQAKHRLLKGISG